MSHLTPNYARIPLSFSRGAGAYLFTKDGTRYLDFVSGVAVNSLGHSAPLIQRVLAEQSAKLIHVSNVFEVPEQEALAKKLCELGGFDRAFFCNSGAEANEAALKLARKATGRTKFVSFEGSFHGRTFGALSVTGKPAIQKDFLPLVPTVETVAWDDIAAVDRAIDDTTAAVIVECIQGEGGVRDATPTFLKRLVKLAKSRGALLIVDEVQTGIGRTGTMFASEQYGIRPDIITLAKGLGGGLPIGAIVTTEKLGAQLSSGSHGTTFGGSPLVCAVASAVVTTIAKPAFLTKVNARSTELREGLKLLKKEFPKTLGALKGRGLLVGIDIATKELRDTIVIHLRETHHILAYSAGDVTLRILPPLTVASTDIRLFLRALHATLTHLTHASK